MKCRAVASYLACIVVNRDPETFVGVTAPVVLSRLPIPGLAQIPVLGQILFTQDPVVYLSFILVPVMWYFIYRTRPGLNLRAIGESPASSIWALSVPRRARLHASPTGTSYSALTTPVTPGICRMYASGIESAEPNQRKLGIMRAAALRRPARWRG